MSNIKESIKYKAYTLRIIALSFTVPFGQIMLDFITNGIKFLQFISILNFVNSLLLVYLGNSIIAYSLELIEKAEKGDMNV
ncbi:MAG: hypothetical protein HRT47_12035 [Candidatus Caenarcaniphilales bacterium]|nr:hypothetical protein [Candidatus Caenarcaniphilales bacterium]